MRDFSQILAKALFILASCASECSAFTESSSRQVPNGQAIRSSVGIKNGLVLGPTARNGLGYEDVTLGQGRRILPGDSVLCYYVGSYQNGRFGGETVFDQTLPDEGPPAKFVVGKGQVIKGWDLGILGGLEGEITPMNVGGRRRLSVPAGLAYGSDQVGPIPPNQDLDFELEVVQAGKESDISLPFRLGGYAVALGVPLLILLLAFNLLGK